MFPFLIKKCDKISVFYGMKPATAGGGAHTWGPPNFWINFFGDVGYTKSVLRIFHNTGGGGGCAKLRKYLCVVHSDCTHCMPFFDKFDNKSAKMSVFLYNW